MYAKAASSVKIEFEAFLPLTWSIVKHRSAMLHSRDILLFVCLRFCFLFVLASAETRKAPRSFL